MGRKDGTLVTYPVGDSSFESVGDSGTYAIAIVRDPSEGGASADHPAQLHRVEVCCPPLTEGANANSPIETKFSDAFGRLFFLGAGVRVRVTHGSDTAATAASGGGVASSRWYLRAIRKCSFEDLGLSPAGLPSPTPSNGSAALTVFLLTEPKAKPFVCPACFQRAKVCSLVPHALSLPLPLSRSCELDLTHQFFFFALGKRLKVALATTFVTSMGTGNSAEPLMTSVAAKAQIYPHLLARGLRSAAVAAATPATMSNLIPWWSQWRMTGSRWW